MLAMAATGATHASPLTVSGPSRRMSSQREVVLIPGPGHDLVECLADYSSSHASKRALIRS